MIKTKTKYVVMNNKGSNHNSEPSDSKTFKDPFQPGEG
jgi:hypothetical protein